MYLVEIRFLPGRYAAAAPIEIRSEHSTAFGKSIAITRSQLQSFPTRSTL
ncbi:hypothetical protein CCHR01_07897 [Colletotrichum chrysophilum]|uniref:Uncharacterized protein n=1 Tax=Colletotrichum chrysophilum TaxID=1836956 RepID=A0AAD9EJ85_9PEZI|nr:hypothetical protein CCHR01_07897 [Colletotrichum chrysophilum]